MRALILNGALGPDPLLDQLTARIASDFSVRKYAVDIVRLHAAKVAHCQGCFECWTHTPGNCKIDDEGRDLSHEFSVSDVVVLVTPVQFGSYSWQSKKMLDRTIGTLLPFFRRVDGEVHHSPRYAYPPSFGVLAVEDSSDIDVERTVRVLALRNAINFTAPSFAVGCITRQTPAGAQFGECDTLVSTLTTPTPRGSRTRIENVDHLLPSMPLASDGAPPKRAMLLVGSGKPRGTSTSESLGTELLEKLALHGVAGVVKHVVHVSHGPTQLREFTEELRQCDLLIIASPIYIDALPALVTRAMEAVVSDRAAQETPAPLSVVMLLNCGFPESRHAAVARTIGALFARVAHARWAGALQLGAGGVISGRPLADVGHLAEHLPGLLDAAAEALSRGRSIPVETREAFAAPLMPTGLYMAAGDAGWLWTATHEGALTRLWQRPAVVDV